MVDAVIRWLALVYLPASFSEILIIGLELPYSQTFGFETE
jgi:hypothetical protein